MGGAKIVRGENLVRGRGCGQRLHALVVAGVRRLAGGVFRGNWTRFGGR